MNLVMRILVVLNVCLLVARLKDVLQQHTLIESEFKEIKRGCFKVRMD